MQPVRHVRVKVCCISSREEARLAVEWGADALGLVSRMPSGPGVIDEALITEFAATAPPGVTSFLLTCEEDAEQLISQARRTRVNTVQLVDTLPVETLRRLRSALPSVKVVQVVHVVDASSVEQARAVAREVDALLLDSGNPSLAVKELGGTGRVHDWSLSRSIRETVSVPVFLAGGLKPENVAEAIQSVGPFGLDVCNGLRTEGALDADKLQRFMRAVRAAEG
ncbi:phosphoribosylanthranilate isomerase [Myxococcus fulvus]|uniref:N-(5'-phosphoribosyl)anthranilate isomerase n=1 Tax=Myxococcus fulvus TaxID=33 RepID=A0A511THZ4_MYXFU|nr:phosphoribosylanthranilate isomerase [Myxococcus fulvus]GEN12828.1 N-(5'-phosphoribosyl)anthranilate isomerase [Myxococcus fulvus]SET88647.1 phosphoribosylanthranilate isomerase [Myxococcus fulvus]